MASQHPMKQRLLSAPVAPPALSAVQTARVTPQPQPAASQPAAKPKPAGRRSGPAPFQEGEEVEVLPPKYASQGIYYPAIIQELRPSKGGAPGWSAYVHYCGWNDSWDQWVQCSQMRAVSPEATARHHSAKAAGTRSTPADNAAPARPQRGPARGSPRKAPPKGPKAPAKASPRPGLGPKKAAPVTPSKSPRKTPAGPARTSRQLVLEERKKGAAARSQDGPNTPAAKGPSSAMDAYAGCARCRSHFHGGTLGCAACFKTLPADAQRQLNRKRESFAQPPFTVRRAKGASEEADGSEDESEDESEEPSESSGTSEEEADDSEDESEEPSESSGTVSEDTEVKDKARRKPVAYVHVPRKRPVPGVRRKVLSRYKGVSTEVEETPAGQESILWWVATVTTKLVGKFRSEVAAALAHDRVMMWTREVWKVDWPKGHRDAAAGKRVAVVTNFPADTYFDEVPVLQGLKNFNAAKKYALQKSAEEAGKVEVVMSAPGKSGRPIVLVNGARPTSTLAVKKRGVKCALQGTRIIYKQFEPKNIGVLRESKHTSKYLGVHSNSLNSHQASCVHKYIGSFKRALTAAMAYDRALIYHIRRRGGKAATLVGASLNFPAETYRKDIPHLTRFACAVGETYPQALAFIKEKAAKEDAQRIKEEEAAEVRKRRAEPAETPPRRPPSRPNLLPTSRQLDLQAKAAPPGARGAEARRKRRRGEPDSGAESDSDEPGPPAASPKKRRAGAGPAEAVSRDDAAVKLLQVKGELIDDAAKVKALERENTALRVRVKMLEREKAMANGRHEDLLAEITKLKGIINAHTDGL